MFLLTILPNITSTSCLNRSNNNGDTFKQEVLVIYLQLLMKNCLEDILKEKNTV